MLSDKRVITPPPPNVSSLPLGKSAFLIGQAHPEWWDDSFTLKGSRKCPPPLLSIFKYCFGLTEILSRCGHTQQAPTSRAVCDLLNLGSWFLTTKIQTNTTGVRPHATLEFTIMEMPSIGYFSLPAPSCLCIFISGLWPAVPLGSTGPAASFYTQPCAYLGEKTLSTTTESRITSEFQEIANSAIEWNHPDFLQRHLKTLVPQPSQMQVSFLSQHRGLL